MLGKQIGGNGAKKWYRRALYTARHPHTLAHATQTTRTRALGASVTQLCPLAFYRPWFDMSSTPLLTFYNERTGSGVTD